jgi:hypothetical protein
MYKYQYMLKYSCNLCEIPSLIKKNQKSIHVIILNPPSNIWYRHNDLQNITHKTKDRVTQTPPKI